MIMIMIIMLMVMLLLVAIMISISMSLCVWARAWYMILYNSRHGPSARQRSHIRTVWQVLQLEWLTSQNNHLTNWISRIMNTIRPPLGPPVARPATDANSHGVQIDQIVLTHDSPTLRPQYARPIRPWVMPQWDSHTRLPGTLQRRRQQVMLSGSFGRPNIC